MSIGKAETARVREALRCLIDLSGLSYREIARRLADKGCGLDVSRLLSGKFQLKVHQMLDILRVLEVHPVEFFRLVFRAPQKQSPLLERMRALFASTTGEDATRLPGARLPERDVENLRLRVNELAQMVEKLSPRPK